MSLRNNFINLFINYNAITNYILIIYELSNLDHVDHGVMSQIRISDGNRNHDPHANSLAHYPLDYQGTKFYKLFQINVGNFNGIGGSSVIFNFFSISASKFAL